MWLFVGALLIEVVIASDPQLAKPKDLVSQVAKCWQSGKAYDLMEVEKIEINKTQEEKPESNEKVLDRRASAHEKESCLYFWIMFVFCCRSHIIYIYIYQHLIALWKILKDLRTSMWFKAISADCLLKSRGIPCDQTKQIDLRCCPLMWVPSKGRTANIWGKTPCHHSLWDLCVSLLHFWVLWWLDFMIWSNMWVVLSEWTAAMPSTVTNSSKRVSFWFALWVFQKISSTSAWQWYVFSWLV